ncbi:DNA ligase D [Roseateles sp.]|uniref:DNA ligase D n=1 Tax=Roseateles sp. TaxID=1971397 RepID=UPI0031DBB53D
MLVATWNVNNVRKRLDQLLDWLERRKPDVVALQELKAVTEDFPAAELRAAGYESLVIGQKSWNGVALLARGHEPLAVLGSLPGDPKDREARYIEAAISGVLFACLYAVNGNPCPGPKFDAKLRWLERMRGRAQALWVTGQPVVLMGDWNVVPTDADIYKPDTWRDNALLQPQARDLFAQILVQGWTDAVRAVHPEDPPPFTFWDYRRKRWERDAGLRIDHILTSAAFSVVDAGVDKDERGWESPSDHAPVWAELGPVTASAKRKRSSSRQASAPPPLPPAGATAPLAKYNQKRDFTKTAEPAGTVPTRRRGKDEPLQFVIQKHWASRLHYDFRLELDGVMLSWAVPKGPSYDPAVKQMAIHVEDHPLDYNEFQGTIARGEYGAGTVIVWDRGTWTPTADAREGLAKGKLIFKLHGQKLAGLWELVRISKPGEKKQDQWLLLKKRGDAWARPSSEYDVITALPDSVVDKPLGLIEEREPREVVVAAPHAAVDAKEDLKRAKKSALPEKLAPQLATLTSSVPPGDWVVETKFDGYRLLVRIDRGAVRLFTRNGNDWTSKFKPLVAALASLGIRSAWLDGEIVVMNDRGVPDFNALQNAIDNSTSQSIQMFLFDAPFLDGMDLRDVALVTRRALLKQRLAERGAPGHADSGLVHFSESFEALPQQLLHAACQLGLEGVMLKRADAPYASRRTETWLKLKCQMRQEFVVIGFTDRSGSKSEVGSLLLAYHEGGTLRSAGSVGTGWNAGTGRSLHAMLSKLITHKPAVDASGLKPGRWTKRTPGSERWVKPTTVVEVAFSEWTPDGQIRHPAFRGVRTDKPASAIIRERASGGPAQPGAKRAAGVAARKRSGPPAPALKITNPDRVIDPSTGLTKLDLVRYYESVADWILPHIKGRAISLVRAPQGIGGQLFFQKHPEVKMPGLTQLDAALWPGHSSLMSVDSPQALLRAAQMNAVEFHTWNSKAKDIDRPDRVIFDLDPGEGVTWTMLQEAAVLMRALLDELGLAAWLKTSGGKGLHVVVPLTPQLPYDEVKRFSQLAVQHMAKTIPSRFVAKAGGANRVGRIFIDYLRNGHGQTTAAAFSARARPGMGVSMPVAWEQLKELKSGAQWTIATAREYLSFQHADPWQAYWKKRQTVGKAMKVLEP